MSDLKSYWSNGNDSSAGIYCRKERRPKLAYYAMQSVATLFDGMEIAPDLGLYPEIPLNNTSVLAKNALQCFDASAVCDLLAGNHTLQPGTDPLRR